MKTKKLIALPHLESASNKILEQMRAALERHSKDASAFAATFVSSGKSMGCSVAPKIQQSYDD
jgi:hypothetical protein